MSDKRKISGMLIAGVDEAGRGPLAGPVVAAAVILDWEKPINGLADSKKLTEKKRNELVDEIRLKALAWSLGWADVDEIDAINILQATLLAMKRAVETLAIKPDHVVVDGNITPELSCQSEAIIKGDETVAEISAASILAKVARDREMKGLDKLYPHYDFAKNKGYPTKKHINALTEHGISPVHRKSFGPVRAILNPGY